jgi:anthranilate phosphoribosyltransferase|tara:strand:- start:2577 stop:3590 length:1014 start_codon:yes stop_codon:yes gene_type:complete
MIQEAIAKLVEKQDLTQKEAEVVMNEIMEGKATDAQIAGFLIALRLKGETIDEITACAKVMRQKASTIKPKAEFLVDTCGTGGDASNTFNVSTAAAFVAAGADISVAKHGNKSVSSKCGSADVLAALGVNIELQAKQVEKCIEEVGIGFMFAPLFHPAMKHVMPARKETGVRTIFNVLGPLTNPAGAESQVIGIFDPTLLTDIANTMKNLGSKHVMVVNGDGLDEITIAGKTKVAELKNGKVKVYDINPEDYGFEISPLNSIVGGDAKENAKIIEGVLKGEKGPKQDIVLLNAGAAIYTSGKVNSFKEGIEAAKQSIDSGNAFKKLEALKKFTNSTN